MTATTARLARRRIARKTGTSMLFRLGLCSESRREEGTSHHVAATAGVREDTQPAEAASGRPGTAGTDLR
jgi:hypothetical protein